MQSFIIDVFFSMLAMLTFPSHASWPFWETCDVIPAPGCRCTFMSDADVTCSDLGLRQISNLRFDPDDAIGRLDISYNAFDEFGNIGPLPTIRGLDFSHNAVFLALDQSTFVGLAKDLVYLNLRDTKQTNIQRAIGNLINLRELDLSYNNIEIISPGILDNLTRLEILHLEGNQIRQIAAFSFLHTISLQEISMTLVDDTEACATQCRIKDSYLQNLPRVRSLKLTDYIIRDLSFLKDFQHVEMLDLSRTGLTDSVAQDIPGHARYRSLNLAMNELTTVPYTDRQYYYVKPASLSLRHSNLATTLTRPHRTQAMPNVFEELVHLSLTGNYIDKIILDNLLSAKSLQFIDLSDNFISEVEYHGSLDRLNHVTIALRGNMLDCDCSMLWLVDLIGSEASNSQGPFPLYDVYNLQCIYLGSVRTLLEVYDEGILDSVCSSGEDMFSTV